MPNKTFLFIIGLNCYITNTFIISYVLIFHIYFSISSLSRYGECKVHFLWEIYRIDHLRENGLRFRGNAWSVRAGDGEEHRVK